MIRQYTTFLGRTYVRSFSGSRTYNLWMLLLIVLAWVGGHTYFLQIAGTVSATGMTDQVPWGLYNANFNYLTGLAVSAVCLAIAAHVLGMKQVNDATLLGGLLAIVATLMALLFITVDIGRLDRFWHVIPFLGAPNLPSSMLAWDVVVLTAFLFLNVYICSYIFYIRYLGKRPSYYLYGPYLTLSIILAVVIHFITAFMYAGLVGRPFWNTGLVASRFLGSSMTAGPALLIIVFQVIRRFAKYDVGPKPTKLLRYIVTAALLVNIFLFCCETFLEFYGGRNSASSTYYLLFGLNHLGQYYGKLVPWIWAAIGMQIAAALIFVIRALRSHPTILNAACLLTVVGIWIEKGIGMVIPGFVPSPQGSIVEYSPSWVEILVSVGIWAFGILVFSWMLHMAIPIMSGKLHVRRKEEPLGGPAEAISTT